MCITGEKNKQNATEKKPTSCHATVHTTGSGARNEDMNFCVNMVKCTVCMSVYDYICCHYMRGGYRVLWVKTFYTALCSTFENTWVCGPCKWKSKRHEL